MKVKVHRSVMDPNDTSAALNNQCLLSAMLVVLSPLCQLPDTKPCETPKGDPFPGSKTIVTTPRQTKSKLSLWSPPLPIATVAIHKAQCNTNRIDFPESAGSSALSFCSPKMRLQTLLRFLSRTAWWYREPNSVLWDPSHPNLRPISRSAKLGG
jgi:hypothetical protein